MGILKSSETVTYRDFVLLRVILISTSEGETLKFQQLKDEINLYLRVNEIGLDKASPVAGNGPLQADIAKLRQFGFLAPTGPYRLTPAGTFLMQTYDRDTFPAAGLNLKEKN